VPDDPEGAYDFGLGAGFYVDATQAPWAANYRMESYIVSELPDVIAANFPADMARQGLTGHSMGGHGALTLALKDPGRWKSVSAFAPISSPMRCPWGEKALGGYLGPDRAAWRRHDGTALIEDGARLPELLVDQGEADNFLEGQLKPSCWRPPAAPRASRSRCAASRATTTATTSSRRSWRTTSAGTPSGCGSSRTHSPRRSPPSACTPMRGFDPFRTFTSCNLMGRDRISTHGPIPGVRHLTSLVSLRVPAVISRKIGELWHVTIGCHQFRNLRLIGAPLFDGK